MTAQLSQLKEFRCITDARPTFYSIPVRELSLQDARPMTSCFCFTSMSLLFLARRTQPCSAFLVSLRVLLQENRPVTSCACFTSIFWDFVARRPQPCSAFLVYVQSFVARRSANDIVCARFTGILWDFVARRTSALLCFWSSFRVLLQDDRPMTSSHASLRGFIVLRTSR